MARLGGRRGPADDGRRGSKRWFGFLLQLSAAAVAFLAQPQRRPQPHDLGNRRVDHGQKRQRVVLAWIGPDIGKLVHDVLVVVGFVVHVRLPTCSLAKVPGPF